MTPCLYLSCSCLHLSHQGFHCDVILVCVISPWHSATSDVTILTLTPWPLLPLHGLSSTSCPKSYECFLLFLEGDPVSCGCPETPVEPEKKKKKRRKDDADQEQSEDCLLSLIVYSIFPPPPFPLLYLCLTFAQSSIISRLFGRPCRSSRLPL